MILLGLVLAGSTPVPSIGINSKFFQDTSIVNSNWCTVDSKLCRMFILFCVHALLYCREDLTVLGQVLHS